MSERVETIIAALDLDEKAALTAGVDMWHATGNERLGIRGLKVTDGPNGARGNSWSDTTSACAPCGTALGATWNPELVGRVGTVLGQEAATKRAALLLAPTVNLHRSPLAGRNFECYSEDPLLSARLAVAFVDAVQAEGVGCSIKHFVANDSEFQRHSISSEVSERALRELYYVPFEAAVRHSNVASVMTAYNRINGIFASEHPDLMAVLAEWGFDGFVVSDWWGIQSTVGTALHGCDLEMPGPAKYLGPALADAIRAGDVTEEHLDGKLRRLLGVMERLGVLDDSAPLIERSDDRPEHRAALRAAATEAVVLLRNESVDGVPALPLRPAELRRVAVIGPNSDAHLVQGGGSSSVNPHHSTTILDGLWSRFGDDVEITTARGCDSYRNLPPLDHRWMTPSGTTAGTAAGDHADGMTIEYFEGRSLDGAPVATAHTRIPRLTWLGDPVDGLTGGDFSGRISGTFTSPITGEFEFSMIVGGHGRLLIDGELVIDGWETFVPGDTFFELGSQERRHRMRVVEGQQVEVVGEYTCFDQMATAAFLLGGLPVLEDNSIGTAADLASDADAALVVVGLNQDWETEGQDRDTWDLPGDSVALIRAVAAAQPRTIVLVQAGSPVEMSWVDDVAAVAQIWYLGQETGDAIADLLSGDVSPSGKLPTTLPRRFHDHPAFENYPGEFGEVRYGEGVFGGYRFYDRRDLDVRFPFGHGLGYSEFEIDWRHLDVGDSTVALSLTVSNVGDVRAAEVVQVYVAPLDARVQRPPQELKGFAKVWLDPGEETTVRIELDERSFQHWDTKHHEWRRSGAKYELRVGTSSRDIALTERIEFSAA